MSVGKVEVARLNRSRSPTGPRAEPVAGCPSYLRNVHGLALSSQCPQVHAGGKTYGDATAGSPARKVLPRKRFIGGCPTLAMKHLTALLCLRTQRMRHFRVRMQLNLAKPRSSGRSTESLLCVKGTTGSVVFARSRTTGPGIRHARALTRRGSDIPCSEAATPSRRPTTSPPPSQSSSTTRTSTRK